MKEKFVPNIVRHWFYNFNQELGLFLAQANLRNGRVNVDVRAPCDGGGAVEVPHQVQNPLLDLLTDILAGPVNCVIYGANDISN